MQVFYIKNTAAETSIDQLLPAIKSWCTGRLSKCKATLAIIEL